MVKVNEQLITKENDLLENVTVREKYLENIEVLDKVKKLVMLDKTSLTDVKFTAQYFNISKGTLDSLISDNFLELKNNGYKVLKNKELKKFKGNLGNPSSLKYTSSYAILNKRTVLNIAMLLRDSEIAKEIRRQLLDFVEDNKQDLVSQITKEQILQLKVINAKTTEEAMLSLREYNDYKERNTKEKVVKQLKDDIDVARGLTTGKRGFTFNSFSKALKIKGLGRNNLFKLLRDKNILMSSNEPYQKYMDYFNVSINKFERNGKEIIAIQTYINPKGVKFIFKKLNKWGYIITKSIDEILEELENN